VDKEKVKKIRKLNFKLRILWTELKEKNRKARFLIDKEKSSLKEKGVVEE